MPFAVLPDQSVFKRSMPSGLTRGWIPVRVKKMRQIKNLQPRFDSIETETAPDAMLGIAIGQR
jgi:hypothetical protein